MRGSLTCGRKRVSARHDIFQIDINSNMGTSATPSIPAHEAGDLLVAMAGSNTSDTPPTASAGWNLIDSAGGNSCSMAIYSRTAVADNHTITWTGSGPVHRPVWVFKNGLLGDTAIVNGTGTTLDFPALTITDPSCVVFFVFSRATQTDIGDATIALHADFDARVNTNTGGNPSRWIADTGPATLPGGVTILLSSFNPSDGTFDTTTTGYCAGAFAVSLN